MQSCLLTHPTAVLLMKQAPAQDDALVTGLDQGNDLFVDDIDRLVLSLAFKLEQGDVTGHGLGIVVRVHMTLDDLDDLTG